MGFRKGTGFTNLNKVMTANRGNRLGSAVAGGISTQNQGVNTGIKTSQQKFEEEAQKNRLDTDEAKNKREEILGRFNQPGQLVSSSGTSSVPGAAQTSPAPAGLERTIMASSTSQPNQATQPWQPAQTTYQSPVSEQEILDFNNYRTGTYAGPSELRDSGALFSKAQQAEQLGDLSKSTGGRQELLRRFVGQGDYSQGQRQLDETLLGQDAAGLRGAARQTRGATGRVSEANQKASGLAQEYAGRAKIFGQETLGRIGEVKAPLSSQLDTGVTGKQTEEDARLANLASIQGMLTGTGDQYTGLEKWTRTGLALQDAANKQYLSQSDVNALLGEKGLLQRGANLGLDMNSMINERLKNTIAQNTGRTGVASDEEIAKLNALDRLAGKSGTDLEFLQGQGDYIAGKTGFDTASLLDYISKTENERNAAANKAAADEAEKAKENARYLNQSLTYGQNALGGLQGMMSGDMSLADLTRTGISGAGAGLGMYGASAAGGGLAAGAMGGMGAVAGPAALAALGVDVLTGSDSTAKGAQALADTGLNVVGAGQQGQNAILEGLLKLNIGGNSIDNTPLVGEQLRNVLAYVSDAQNKAIDEGRKASQDITGGVGGLTKDGLSDLTSGNVGNILNNLMGATGHTTATRVAGNIVNEISRAPSNVAKAASKALKSITGGGIKISDEDLKTDIEYSQKDVQGFMDRIKPVSYDYKDEVKNDPRASKDRQIGVMAQDLEKSKLGKQAVHEADIGKVVDYKDLEPKMLASLAALNQRLKKLEGSGNE